MALNGRHVGGRPTKKQDGDQHLGDLVLFQMGQERLVLVDIIALTRQLAEQEEAAEALEERAAQLNIDLLKHTRRIKVINENVKRFASLRIQELRLDEEQAKEIIAALRGEAKPARPWVLEEVVRT